MCREGHERIQRTRAIDGQTVHNHGGDALIGVTRRTIAIECEQVGHFRRLRERFLGQDHVAPAMLPVLQTGFLLALKAVTHNLAQRRDLIDRQCPARDRLLQVAAFGAGHLVDHDLSAPIPGNGIGDIAVRDAISVGPCDNGDSGLTAVIPHAAIAFEQQKQDALGKRLGLHEVSLFVDDKTADIVADGLDDANVARRWASLRVHGSFLHRVMDIE